MSHLITAHDRVFSNKGKEWHGKAIVPSGIAATDSLTRKHIDPILFPIVEIPAITGVMPDGSQVSLNAWKAVAADLRGRGNGVVPLAIHSEGYRVIENTAVYEALENAMDGTQHRVTTAGTLDGCKRFFLTVELSQHSLLNIPGEDWKAFLCFVTSHDGSLALRVYDSGTRIVCNNTLIMSYDDKGKRCLRIKHTAGASLQVENFPAFLEGVLKGRESFAGAYARLMESSIRKDEAFAGLLGMYWKATGEKDELSSRAENTVAGIMDRFEHGKGNNGQTFADLLNGFTEYYTSGEGCGQKTTAFERTMASQFGSQADRKAEFASLLMSDDRKAWQGNVDAGRKYLSGLERNRAVSGTYGQRAVQPAVQPVAVQSGEDVFASLLDSPLPARD